MNTNGRYSRSRTLFRDAQSVIPGGVNSPVRAFRGVGGTPPYVQSAAGAYVMDEDGNRYLDFVGSWGPMIVGHTHPAVLEAVQETLKRGFSFGAPTAGESRFARMIIERVPSVEMVRLVNSGTEATMSALRLARAATGRDLLVKFAGCYHGHADPFLVAAGSGTLDIGVPDSPGVPKAVAAGTLIARFNDLESVDALLQAHPGRVAAIIVEPVGGNAGCIPPVPGFLEGLRRLCDAQGSLLIFDEVMTGFRVARGGAAELYDIRPDLITFGKVVGGGFPIGAYAGPSSIMRQVAPSGPVYQAGTLSGNPVAVSAGIATLELLDQEAYRTLEALGQHVEDGLTRAIREGGWPMVVQRVGSMFTPFFRSEPVRNVDDASDADMPRFRTFFHAMLGRGYYLAPSAYECSFLSLAHTRETLNGFLESAVGVLTGIMQTERV